MDPPTFLPLERHHSAFHKCFSKDEQLLLHFSGLAKYRSQNHSNIYIVSGSSIHDTSTIYLFVTLSLPHNLAMTSLRHLYGKQWSSLHITISTCYPELFSSYDYERSLLRPWEDIKEDPEDKVWTRIKAMELAASSLKEYIDMGIPGKWAWSAIKLNLNIGAPFGRYPWSPTLRDFMVALRRKKEVMRKWMKDSSTPIEWDATLFYQWFRDKFSVSLLLARCSPPPNPSEEPPQWLLSELRQLTALMDQEAAILIQVRDQGVLDSYIRALIVIAISTLNLVVLFLLQRWCLT
jgi:hypothetical protein